MITALEPNQIFVFGSNLAGKHGGGAAAQAHKDFNAEMGVGEGVTGRCYALPTLGKNLEKRSDEQLVMSVRRFFKVARENPDKQFLLTAVGTGIAGYDSEYMRSLFTVKARPKNVVLPEEWNQP